MGRSVVRRTADRLVLVGDAAGFVDSISADGLSIAFNSAILLGRELPGAIARGATAASFARYERAARALFRSYWAVTNGLLWIARHPRFRSALIHRLERHPAVCEAMMGGAMKLMLAAAPTSYRRAPSRSGRSPSVAEERRRHENSNVSMRSEPNVSLR
jgi:flavin-dependent dehydrogenase